MSDYKIEDFFQELKAQPSFAAKKQFLLGKLRGYCLFCKSQLTVAMHRISDRNQAKYELGISQYYAGNFTDAASYLKDVCQNNIKQFPKAAYYMGNMEQIGYLTHTQSIKIIIASWLDIHYRIVPNMQKAISYYEQAIDLGGNKQLAIYMKNKLENSNRITAVPSGIITETFDMIASNYEEIYLGNLQYTGHKRLLRDVEQSLAGDNKRLSVLDLGCGTGLVGELLRKSGLTKDIVGIDIAAKLLKQAATKEFNDRRVYDKLEKIDIISHLKKYPQQYDLITAASVLQSFGDLHEVLSLCKDSLIDGGILSISLEQSVDADIKFDPVSNSFSHGLDYIRLCIKDIGYSELSVNSFMIYESCPAYQVTLQKIK
jgi:predicted TPR repeat methyltransferase